MKLVEAAEQGITRVRKPFWNPHAYLDLHVTDEGKLGPWGKLMDVGLDEPMTISTLDSTSDWLAVSVSEGVDDA